MANNVFANGREVSCKKADGKSICAFPDVCFTPPENPATPPGVPIPYPNTGIAKDTTKGSKKVKISGKEVNLKNKSHFKKSYGDEAGCATKKGVITSKNRGKVYFNAWSMDVKFEGKNVVRHFDLTTHNHASVPGNSPTWPYLDDVSVSPGHPCHDDMEKEAAACSSFDPHTPGGGSPCPPDKTPKPDDVTKYAVQIEADECLRARRCALSPYDPKRCCKGQTPHHLVEASSFFDQGRGGKIKDGPRKGQKSVMIQGVNGYDAKKAPCVCAEGSNQYQGTHGLVHIFQNTAGSEHDGVIKLSSARADDGKTEIPTKVTNYKDARDAGVQAVTKAFPSSGCNPKCLESQLNEYHRQCGIKDRTPIQSVKEGYKDDEIAVEYQTYVSQKAASI
ncbi:MAG: PAAR-like domain-containing protein [Candidatus Thiodiazotropha endolucinida]